MVSVHYDDIKMLDIFSYYTLWVPPEITMQYSAYSFIKKNIISMDDYIIHDDGGMYNHLKTLLYDTNRTIEGAQFLTASLPRSTAITPKLTNPRLFYCGINWEKLIGKKKARHAELFKYFNKYEHIDIYGPKKTWQGCRKYKGTIPFDGVSILSKINEAGIVLALSSDAHWRAGSATNRIYEGCAGGAVIISDTNPFIVEHFGDSVLYFDYDKDHPDKMFKQIKDHVTWIRSNPEEAKKLAEKSQNIWLEKYALEEQLKTIVNRHPEREKLVSDILYAKSQDKNVLATLVLDTKLFNTDDKEILINTVKNVEKQIYKNIKLIIACDSKYVEEIKKTLININTNLNYQIKDYIIYDKFNNKLLTKGQILKDIIDTIQHDYWLPLLGNEGLFKDHVTTLIKTFEDNQNDNIAAVYSGQLVEKKNEKFDSINYCYKPISSLFNYQKKNLISTSLGCYLLNSKIEKFLPDYVFTNIDGLELNAILLVAIFKYKYKILFSKRMTNRIKASIQLKQNFVIKPEYQRNLIEGLVNWEIEEDLCSNIKNTDIYQTSQLNRLLKRYLTIKIYLQKIGLFFSFLSPKSKNDLKSRLKRYEEVKQNLFIINDIEV